MTLSKVRFTINNNPARVASILDTTLICWIAFSGIGVSLIHLDIELILFCVPYFAWAAMTMIINTIKPRRKLLFLQLPFWFFGGALALINTGFIIDGGPMKSSGMIYIFVLFYPFVFLPWYYLAAAIIDLVVSRVELFFLKKKGI